jgi:hypothetical protein
MLCSTAVGLLYLPEFVPLDPMSIGIWHAQGNHGIFRGGPYGVWDRSIEAQSLPDHVVEICHSIELIHGRGVSVKCACLRIQFSAGFRVTPKSVEGPGDGETEDFM